MYEEIIAAMHKALGDPTRLRIFSFLCRCSGPVALENTGVVRPVEGHTVGEVCCHITGTDKITSTISHHIKELRLAGLITVERHGRHMVCRTNHAAAQVLADHLHQLLPNLKGTCCAASEGKSD
jgi:DNA-binding transcriptional ArsR family regulator